VKAIEAEGFRDSQLHRLAMMLHDPHPLGPSPSPAPDAP
jgi:cation transport protein ChaC